MVSKRPSDRSDGESQPGQPSSVDVSADTAFDRLLQEAAKSPSLGRVIAPGTRLSEGRFEILQRIGEGGMGMVYEAFDTARKEKVALKTMSRLEASDVYRLKNEFRALADVSHPNLVCLHELCADEGLWFFTMELIDGERFDRWVRPRAGSRDPKGTLDQARLRSALPQLVEGVAAIHAVGKLHRDLKPSNVFVTGEGRVVVLDFGLAIDPGAGGVGQTLVDDNVSGTPAYMAPEQALGRTTTTASDFYALGVMLFEALTGKLPFDGQPHEMLVDKQRSQAPLASGSVQGVPSDLDELCARLLARDPSARPDATALRVLLPPPDDKSSNTRSYGSLGASGGSGRGASYVQDAAPELLGRDAELAALRDAFQATLSAQAVVLFVSGASGMGKSALCEAFLYELRSQGRATVLAGRCYERENVPFKGFDSLVDDLSRHLRRLPREDAIAVLPREVHALTRLFPVLGRVEVVAAAPQREILDPLELRRRAYGAFGELLARMRDRGPLCVHLDDVQWLDSDAVLFMRALMVHPEPTPMLLLLSHRSENAESTQALSSVRDAIEGNSRLQQRTHAIEPLSQAAARELALRLLPEATGDREAAATTVARESSGSPFFVGELCRFVGRHRSDSGALERLSLHAALGDHLSTLPGGARRLLEHSALAGKPLPAQLLLKAAQASHAELDRLRSSHLLRLSRIEGSPIVECYHDMVRETVAGGLSELLRVGCYASLASALQTSEHPDPELLATCFEGAGQLAAAAEHCARAADQAMAGTAFQHAAALYEKALALGSFTPERAHALRVARGEALAHVGRGKQAADVFLRAAEDVQGEQRRNLRRRAAQELLGTGHTEEGMALFRELFVELGLTLPSSDRAALTRLLISQLRLRLRGLDYTPRDPSTCAPQDLQALAMYRSSLSGLSLTAPIVAASVTNDYALRALAAGAPEHVAAALGVVAYNLALSQPAATARIERITSELLRIGREIGDARYLGLTELSVGSSWIICCQWKRGRKHIARSLEILRGQAAAEHSWIDSAETFVQQAAFNTGDWLHIANTTPQLVEQGYSRERISIAVALSGHAGSVAWLFSDDALGYERILQRAKARWRRVAEAQWPDFHISFGEVATHLYRGQADQALAAVEENRAWLARSFVRRVQATNIFALHFHGSAALAVLRTRDNRALISVVRDCAKRLASLDLSMAAPMRSALEAGLALHAGDLDRGAEHLRAAIAGFDGSDRAMHAAAARRRLGELLGGDEGNALLAQGDAVMQAQRIVNRDAVTEMLCAGCSAP